MYFDIRFLFSAAVSYYAGLEWSTDYLLYVSTLVISLYSHSE